MNNISIVMSLVMTVFLSSGCVTSSKDILSGFHHQKGETDKIKNDLKECESNAFNAGHNRRGGLLTEGPRVEYIELCLEEKAWKKR